MGFGRKTAVPTSFVASLVAAATAASTQSNPVRMGASSSTTGRLAGLGTRERDGVLHLAKLGNADGSIDVRPVEVQERGSNPDGALTTANKLVFSDSVQAIVEPTTSNANSERTDRWFAAKGGPPNRLGVEGPSKKGVSAC